MLTRTLLLIFLAAINSSYALPLVANRQIQATSVTTVKEVTTLSGTMIETCIITLTPIVDINGQPAFEEVRTCTLEPVSSASATPTQAPSSQAPPQGTTLTVVSTTDIPAPSAESNAPSSTGSASPTTANSSAGSVIPSGSASASAAPAESSVIDGNNTSASATGSAAAPSASIDPSIDPNATSAAPSGSTTTTPTESSVADGNNSATVTTSATVSPSVEAPPEATPSADSPSSEVASQSPTEAAPSAANPAETPETSGVVNNPGPAAPSPSASASNGSGSGTAVGAEASESPPAQPAEVVVPGQHVEVLPIGLGVFAGISLIALIVVGLVTYERTKYRKKFRQQKLADSGASMGYGGMAQRL